MSNIEDQLERVLLCDSCRENCESLLYHEARWHYEFYEFDEATEGFTCRHCGSKDIREEFETVDVEGNSTQYVQHNGSWHTLEDMVKITAEASAEKPPLLG